MFINFTRNLSQIFKIFVNFDKTILFVSLNPYFQLTLENWDTQLRNKKSKNCLIDLNFIKIESFVLEKTLSKYKVGLFVRHVCLYSINDKTPKQILQCTYKPSENIMAGREKSTCENRNLPNIRLQFSIMYEKKLLQENSF